jgi:alpha-glucosidase (family GH31 glycosyl hydrolase)
VKLGQGVCSKTGVAVLEDDSLRLDEDGQVKYGRLQGSDKYVFAYGDDYQGAVKALYMLTGKTPLVPRFALGNWWSRYHDYTDKEYLQLLNIFEERNVPLTVATIDMDWHYSVNVDKECKISESGKNSPEYVGNNPWGNVGWTGYTWNENLFPDYKGFLQKVKDKNVKITLNVHPSDGVRFLEA